MEITALKTDHLEDAAKLAVSLYRWEREQVPSLPARHEDPAGFLPLLAGLVGRRTHPDTGGGPGRP